MQRLCKLMYSQFQLSAGSAPDGPGSDSAMYGDSDLFRPLQRSAIRRNAKDVTIWRIAQSHERDAEGLCLRDHDVSPSGPIRVATPGCSSFSRLPKPSVSNVARRSCALWRKCAQPSVWTGTITASGKARAVSIVSLVSMVRWKGPLVGAAHANGSTTPHLKRSATSAMPSYQSGSPLIYIGALACGL